ncbi:Transcriptional activator [Colletotrichum sp. CLE4]
MVCVAFPTDPSSIMAMNAGLDLLRGMGERGNSYMGARYELLANLRSAVMSGTNAHAEPLPPFPTSFSPTELLAPAGEGGLVPSAHPTSSSSVLPIAMGDAQGGGLMAMQGVAGQQRVTFPVVDNSSLGEPFFDESVSTVMDFGLWEEGFADPAMDASFDFSQWTHAAGMTQADDRMDV